MNKEPLDEYFEALERLKKQRAKINNDSVAIEAGRKKGSIKKSRDIFHDLIKAIDAAASEQARPKDEQRERLSKAKQISCELREQLEASLARELSLLHQLYELKKQVNRLTGEKVLPIRGKQ